MHKGAHKDEKVPQIVENEQEDTQNDCEHHVTASFVVILCLFQSYVCAHFSQFAHAVYILLSKCIN